MASNVTVGSIIDQAKELADMVNSEFITDASWLSMANASIQNLYDKLIEAYGSDYYVSTPPPYDITTIAGDEQYLLPDAFYKLLGVDWFPYTSPPDGVQGVTLKPFAFADRNKFGTPGVSSIPSLGAGGEIRYRLRGNRIWFVPTPPGGGTMRVWYAPTFTPLTATSQTFDGINGWEAWAVFHMAKKALTKEESDTSGVDSLLAIEEQRIESLKHNRDAGMPAKVVDIYGINGGHGGSFADDGEGWW